MESPVGHGPDRLQIHASDAAVPCGARAIQRSPVLLNSLNCRSHGQHTVCMRNFSSAGVQAWVDENDALAAEQALEAAEVRARRYPKLCPQLHVCCTQLPYRRRME